MFSSLRRMNDKSSVGSASARAAEPSLIERFGISGLYGYRTISLTSKHAATILIARNGTGKTTLMGALDALLKLQLNRLSNLDFAEIFCRIRGLDRDIILTHADVVDFLKLPTEGDFIKMATKASVEQSKLFQFIIGDYKNSLNECFSDPDGNSVAWAIARAFSHDIYAATKSCEDVHRSLFERTPTLSQLRDMITTALSDYDVVYLPTYRRVELALTDEGEARRRRGRSRPKFSIASSGLHTGDIQFGLGDISDRLSELNNQIISSSNRGYREISENIINELIQGFEVSPDTPRPNAEDLKLFFSRLESSGRVIGPYYGISNPPDYEKIYSNVGVPAESRKFLTYFLGKLDKIINITKKIEKPVDDFINSCNKYLSSIEPSTSLADESPHHGLVNVDAKALKVDRTDLSVHVESLPARNRIPLDALSSGEKQMVSLFAKIYLYPKKKIVLIDEPELSLSIDWQKTILIDVLMSGNCAQLIAITHSPFVFDNVLEKFASTLDLQIADRIEPELPLN